MVSTGMTSSEHRLEKKAVMIVVGLLCKKWSSYIENSKLQWEKDLWSLVFYCKLQISWVLSTEYIETRLASMVRSTASSTQPLLGNCKPRSLLGSLDMTMTSLSVLCYFVWTNATIQRYHETYISANTIASDRPLLNKVIFRPNSFGTSGSLIPRRPCCWSGSIRVVLIFTRVTRLKMPRNSRRKFINASS